MGFKELFAIRTEKENKITIHLYAVVCDKDENREEAEKWELKTEDYGRENEQGKMQKCKKDELLVFAKNRDLDAIDRLSDLQNELGKRKMVGWW